MKFKELRTKFDGATIEITTAGNLRIWGDDQLAGERVVTVKSHLISSFMKVISDTFKEAALGEAPTKRK